MSRFLSLCLFFCATAWASGGMDPVVEPNYKDKVNDFSGLCTEGRGNEKQQYFTQGRCKAIDETLTQEKINDKPNCTAQKFEELRLRLAGEQDKLPKGVKNRGGLGIGLICSSKNNQATENNEALIKDKVKFAKFMKNLIAAIVIEESNWMVNFGGNTNNDQAIKCEGDHCGLLGLNKNDMDNPEYACGCQMENKIDDNKQYDPTMDGPLNLRCGITIALFRLAADKDATQLLGEGHRKDANHETDSRHGLEKTFKSLEPTEKDSQTPLSAMDTPLKRIKAKMQTYCDTEAFARPKASENPKSDPKEDSGSVNGMGWGQDGGSTMK